MGNDKKVQRSSNLKVAVIALVCIIILVGGSVYYMRYRAEQVRRAAEEEQLRREALERELQLRMIEERKAELAALIEEMRLALRMGDYERLAELSAQARALAREYGFSEEEIDRILAQAETHRYLARLSELSDRLDKDAYSYLYVRSEVSAIPALAGIRAERISLMGRTYASEYEVLLNLASSGVKRGMEGDAPSDNYFASVAYLRQAIALREQRGIEASPRERAIRDAQKQLFFATGDLTDRTVPASLY